MDIALCDAEPMGRQLVCNQEVCIHEPGGGDGLTWQVFVNK